jgi:hypothetical protein
MSLGRIESSARIWIPAASAMPLTLMSKRPFQAVLSS